eukprot:gene9069-9823_t
MSSANTPLFVFFLYVAALSITLIGGKPFWIISSLFGLTALFIIFIFIFGSFPHADFEQYADLYESPTSYHMMTFMFVSSTQYMGIQYIPLLGNLCKDPRKQVPEVMMFSVVVCIVTAMLVLVFAAAHAPGTVGLATKMYPLTFNFAPMFHKQTFDVIWLNLPGLFGSTLGLIYCYGRQISGISKTGLLPSVLQESIPYLGTPYVALLMGVMICFIINMTAIYYPYVLDKIMKLSTLASGFVYIFASNREKRNRMKNRLAAGFGKDSTQNKVSSQQNKLTSNLFTNKVAPEVLVDKEPAPSRDVEETVPAYDFRTEMIPSERLPAMIDERRASLTGVEPTHPMSAASSILNLAASFINFFSTKSRTVNQSHSIHKDGADTSGKSVGSILSRASKRSVLSEYQEMVVLQAGGIIDEEENEAPAVFQNMSAHVPEVVNTNDFEVPPCPRSNTDELV